MSEENKALARRAIEEIFNPGASSFECVLGVCLSVVMRKGNWLMRQEQTKRQGS